MTHDRVVTERFLVAENSLDTGYWEEIAREEEYWECENTPLEYRNGSVERVRTGPKGEVDVWCLNYSDKVMMPIEVKTSYGDIGYGREQLERVEKHFDDWTVLKKLLVEP